MNFMTTNPAAERWTSLLLEQGYCVIPNLVSPLIVESIDSDLAADFEETPFCSGSFYGERTKRFGRLLIRSRRARELVQHPLVLAIVRNVLSRWCDTVQLNLTQA
ncbi:MAG: phytanoyl-CoA dioxygenase family protein, partial [Sphingomicrobium sp.]